MSAVITSCRPACRWRSNVDGETLIYILFGVELLALFILAIVLVRIWMRGGRR